MKIIFASLLLIFGFAGCATQSLEMPESWKAVRLGMSREQVHAIVGHPDSKEPEYRNPQNDTIIYAHEHWEKAINTHEGYGLDVCYDSNDRVVSAGPGSWTAIQSVSRASSNDTTDKWMTTFGEFSPIGSPWTVKVSAEDRKLQIIRHEPFGSEGVSQDCWQAKTGWFAFVENDERVWAYDGDKNLFLLVSLGTKGTAIYGPCGFPCAVPNDVLTRISPAARKVIQNDKR